MQQESSGATAAPNTSPGAASAGTAPAATTGRWSVIIDPAVSNATFTVRDKLVTTVHGSLPIEAGSIVVAEDGSVDEAWIRLDATKIATGNPRRDRDLQKPPFLDTSSWPSITLQAVSTRRTPAGAHVAAILTARGEQAPVDLQVELVETPTGAGASEVAITVTGRLDRAPLGIRVPTVVIGRYLQLRAELTLRRSSSGINPTLARTPG